MSEPSPEPVSRLRWYPDRGFELDLNATLDDVTLALVSVPLPVDGTVELRDGPITLDPLEILFKAQVDLDGVPGQLTAATVELRATEHGESIELCAQVEDAETGETQEVTVTAPVVVPAVAPEHGGPRPRPRDESELDWDDDDTIEAYLKDPLTQEDPLPVAERRRSQSPVPPRPSEPDPEGAKRQEQGFNRLMQMLMRYDDEFDDDLGDPESSDESPGRAPSPASPAPRKTQPRAPQMVSDPADARGLLRYLVDQEQLELEDGAEVEELVAGAAPILASSKSAEARSEALSEWLFTQDSVAELYIDDEALARLIDQW